MASDAGRVLDGEGSAGLFCILYIDKTFGCFENVISDVRHTLSVNADADRAAGDTRDPLDQAWRVSRDLSRPVGRGLFIVVCLFAYWGSGRDDY